MNNSNDNMELKYVEEDHTEAFCTSPPSSTCHQRAVVMVLPKQEEGTVFAVYNGLPHPRHDYPCCYVVPRERKELVHSSSNALSSSSSLLSSSSSSPPPQLWEVQSQSPPEGFAQTFFIGTDLVVPQNNNMVATRMDLHFILLRALFEPLVDVTRAGCASSAFLSPEQLLPGLPHASVQPVALEAPHVSVPLAPTSNDCSSSFSPAFDWAGGGGGSIGGGMESAELDEDQSYEDGEDFFLQLRREAMGRRAARGSNGGMSSSFRKTSRGEVEHEFGEDPEGCGGSDAPQQTRRLEGGMRVTDHREMEGTAWWQAWRKAAAELSVPVWTNASSCTASVFPLQEVLAHLPCLLKDFCEVKQHGSEAYYRPSLAKAAKWVAKRIDRVQRSEALRQFLQLPAPIADITKKNNNNGDDAGEGWDELSPHAEALRDAAFGLVSELIFTPILTAMQQEVEHRMEDISPADQKRLCCLLRSESSLEQSSIHTSSNRMTGETSAVSRSNVSTVGGPERRKTQGTPSLGVRKLEKAGKPKGTPTLDFFFGKKK